MPVEAHDPRHASVQAADQLREEIRAGKYPGGRLPSTRALAARFGIATQTVSNGLRILVTEGLIYSAGNRGYFVSSGGPRPNDVEPNRDLGEELKGLRSEIQALAQRVAALEKSSRSSGA
jgi:DNA-binding GntR family transcriptional regulator